MSYELVGTVEKLKTLDQDEMLEGYLDGLADEPEPSGNRSQGYFHGWRNGMIDKGRLKPDAASSELASEIVETGYLRQFC